MRLKIFARLLAVAAAVALLCLPALSQGNDISGKWHFVSSTDQSDYPCSADFAVQSGQVTGKWDTADVKGTFKDGQFDLEFPFTYAAAGMNGTMKLKGKLSEGALVGTWDFAGYTGTFKATRE